ncbi:MAG: bifunctional metallophosphatase/5'-nucleotidase, partial [bacterium]|nr:bifunctional metallophosphatase/5'-nucleotidase [bacterium]
MSISTIQSKKKTGNPLFFLMVCLISVILIPGTLFPGTNATETKKDDTETKIVIFHVNDLHGKINYLAKAGWVIEEERKKTKDVFLFNAGDNFSGNPVVDQYEPKGKPILELLNTLKIDAQTLGNHGFDYGQERLAEIISASKYPILCSNADMSATKIPRPKTYTLLETAGGLKIAVLGFVEVGKDDGIPSTHPDKVKGIVFSSWMENVKKYRHLREKCDIFICLSHLGKDEDELLAKEMPELDIIIGGHSHTRIYEPKNTHGAFIAQAGSYGRNLGRIELLVKNGKITSIKGRLIDLKKIKNEIPEMKKQIAAFNKNPHLERVIATIPNPIEGKKPLGNLITDAIRSVHKLDMAIHNDGGIRAYRIEKDVQLKNIFKLLPFGNDVVKFNLTTKEIKSLIVYGYEKYGEIDIMVSGLRYTVRTTAAKKVKDVILKDEAGNLLSDENKTYTVGMNNYIASAYRFAHKDPGKSLQSTTAQTLIEYLKKNGMTHRNVTSPR